MVDDDIDDLNMFEISNEILPKSGGGIDNYTNYDSSDDSSDNDNEDDDCSDDLNIGDDNAQHLYEDIGEQHPFLKLHPQFQTHQVSFVNDDNIVLNFLGGSLPHCDQGDREYYCLTMLTLFKPWRSGKDLKSADQTWDETFNHHNFTFRQQQLMKNFNLRYECIDARDDYSAQLQDETNSGLFPSWASSDVLKILIKTHFLNIMMIIHLKLTQKKAFMVIHQ